MLGTLYKKDWKTHYKLLVIILLVMAMYFTVILGMYDPADGSVLAQLVAMKLPQEVLAAFGFANADNSLVGFLSSYLYGFLLLVLPLVLIVILANKLVAALVDRGSMAAILSSAVTRRQVALTQAAFLISQVLILASFATGLGLALSALRFPGLMDVPAFLRLNLGLLAIHLCLSGLSFFFSCLFSEARLSQAMGAGLPVLFLVVQMLINYDSGLGALKYFTLFSLFTPENLIGASPNYLPLAALAGLALLLYSAGILVFDQKDLPL